MKVNYKISFILVLAGFIMLMFKKVFLIGVLGSSFILIGFILFVAVLYGDDSK